MRALIESGPLCGVTTIVVEPTRLCSSVHADEGPLVMAMVRSAADGMVIESRRSGPTGGERRRQRLDVSGTQQFGLPGHRARPRARDEAGHQPSAGSDFLDPALVLTAILQDGLRQFGLRVGSHLGHDDSVALLDSSYTTTLRPSHALLYDEEPGCLIKMRPYDRPPDGWVPLARPSTLDREEFSS
jgi:hypothetical protein